MMVTTCDVEGCGEKGQPYSLSVPEDIVLKNMMYISEPFYQRGLDVGTMYAARRYKDFDLCAGHYGDFKKEIDGLNEAIKKDLESIKGKFFPKKEENNSDEV